MSFILDALKKSENERQRQAPAEFVTVPSDPDAPTAPRWLWLLGTLLLVNILVVVVLIARDEVPASAAIVPGSGDAAMPADLGNDGAELRPAPDAAGSLQALPATADFADQLEEARRNLPERTAVSTPTETAAATRRDANATRATRATTPTASTATSRALLPTLDELRLNGEVNLPEMHVDIHVFSDNPRDRFVFINMDKYREQDTLTTGPVLREITREGVVLEYGGKRFILPRE